MPTLDVVNTQDLEGEGEEDGEEMVEELGDDGCNTRNICLIFHKKDIS